MLIGNGPEAAHSDAFSNRGTEKAAHADPAIARDGTARLLGCHPRRQAFCPVERKPTAKDYALEHRTAANSNAHDQLELTITLPIGGVLSRSVAMMRQLDGKSYSPARETGNLALREGGREATYDACGT